VNKSASVLAVVSVLIFASVSQAVGIFYVDVNSPNVPGTGSFGDPFRKIQDAIDATVDGDTVEVRPGIYTGVGNYNLDPNGLSITIRSTDPNNPDVVAATIIDPNEAGRGFYFDSGEDANCIISGFTIRNGRSDEGQSGGGLFCDNNSNPVIVNCIIVDNLTELYGGGVYCNNSNPQIKGCIISNNRGRYGGGLACFNAGNLAITNCTIIKNSVIFSGGGVFCDMNGDTVINSSIIRANKLDYPEYEYGPQVCLFDGSSASISYTNIQEGQEGVSSIASTLSWLSGNIEADPCFAAFDVNGDTNMWDFHLQSAYGRWDTDSQSWVEDSNTSLCIDAGDPNSNWIDEQWPNGKRINMGAYGGTAEASKNGNIADFDVSGTVDLTDLMELASKWLSEQSGIVNLDLAGRADFADFAIFAENWFWQKE